MRFWFSTNKLDERFLFVMSAKVPPVCNPVMHRVDRMNHHRLVDLMAEAATEEIHDATRAAVYDITGGRAPW